MARTRYIEHAGRRIVLLDMAGIGDEAELLAAVAHARAFIQGHAPDGSLLTLTHTTGAVYSRAAVDAFRAMVAENRPFVRAGALVTDNSLHRMVVSTLALTTRRRMQAFAEMDAAKQWLVEQ